LTRHAASVDHQMAINAPKHRKEYEACQSKVNEQHDKIALILFKCIHWLATESIPLLKFKSLLDLLHDLKVEHIDILRQKSLQYDSSTTATELLTVLSDQIEEDLTSHLSNASTVTALADESTDIANHKRLVIYAQTISEEDMTPETHFVANVECNDTSGAGIAKSILTEFEKKGVKAEKIMSLGSDGASVMTGKNNGKRKNIIVEIIIIVYKRTNIFQM